MTTETKIEARGYRGEIDLQPICDLLNTCVTTDLLLSEPYVTVEALGQELGDPNLDKARDLRLWADPAGRVVGYAEARISPPDEERAVDVNLYFRVHPEARNLGIEREIVDWGSERAREVGRERGQPVQMRAGLHLTTPAYIAYRKSALEELGFRPVRYAYKMARSLSEPVPEPEFPPGYVIRTLESDEVDLWVDAFNMSFIDHWNYRPLTHEQHEHWLRDPRFRSDGDQVAIAEGGTIAAFCRCLIDEEDNAKMERDEGWIDVLGTRRGHRKIGLGRAMLLAGMHWLKAQGIGTAVLDVDTENPTGALRLYESVGFQVQGTSVTYRKDL